MCQFFRRRIFSSSECVEFLTFCMLERTRYSYFLPSASHLGSHKPNSWQIGQLMNDLPLNSLRSSFLLCSSVFFRTRVSPFLSWGSLSSEDEFHPLSLMSRFSSFLRRFWSQAGKKDPNSLFATKKELRKKRNHRSLPLSFCNKKRGAERRGEEGGYYYCKRRRRRQAKARQPSRRRNGL